MLQSLTSCDKADKDRAASIFNPDEHAATLTNGFITFASPRLYSYAKLDFDNAIKSEIAFSFVYLHHKRAQLPVNL